MLCSFDPVKYCIAAPYDSSGTTRRSISIPERSRTRCLVSPRARTRSTSGWAASWSIASAESLAVASTSRSPTVSFSRRQLPARVACVTDLSLSKSATIASASGFTSPSKNRLPDADACSMPARIASSVFLPNPLSLAISPLLGGLPQIVQRLNREFFE